MTKATRLQLVHLGADLGLILVYWGDPGRIAFLFAGLGLANADSCFNTDETRCFKDDG